MASMKVGCGAAFCLGTLYVVCIKVNVWPTFPENSSSTFVGYLGELN